ncbi:MAG: hypothetical protein HXY22_09645 [Alphaproteobacteria bacterium]|nr:hypothetical protein [Alphaproteobacteria bacterium]
MADTADVVAAQKSAPSPQPQQLDELMLAMDVVDTLRHNEDLVRREMSEAERDTAFRVRLREIYAGQGIEVPESVIEEGLRALKESRFVYTPAPPSFARTLALLWVRRRPILIWGGSILGALVILIGAYSYFIAGPQEAAREALRIELAETLPRQLQQLFVIVTGEARVEEAKTKAATLFADGKAALERGDRDGARAAIAGLGELDQLLRQEYQIRIVSRPGEASGVFRVPHGNPAAQNFYLIVEAVGPTGSPLEVKILNEENGRERSVKKYGVRVSEAIYNGVKADKVDNGIIENALLGVKRRGELAPEYLMPVLGGMITEWDE